MEYKHIQWAISMKIILIEIADEVYVYFGDISDHHGCSSTCFQYGSKTRKILEEIWLNEELEDDSVVWFDYIYFGM